MNRARGRGIEGQQEVWLGKVQDWASGQAVKVQEEEGQIVGEVGAREGKPTGCFFFFAEIGARERSTTFFRQS